jgi:hypothetical protein
MLDRHCNNYDAEGPNLTKVQLLWWEFPSEHWDALREGSPMNFLHDPVHIIQPNSDMTEEQLVIASQFFDELVDLGIFKELLEGEEMLTNAPLFCLPKAGQPGQWRILADMRKGRQNEAIGADPTICFPEGFGNFGPNVLRWLVGGGGRLEVLSSVYGPQGGPKVPRHSPPSDWSHLCLWVFTNGFGFLAVLGEPIWFQRPAQAP